MKIMKVSSLLLFFSFFPVMWLVKEDLSDEDSHFCIRKSLLQHIFIVISLSKNVLSDGKIKITKSILVGAGQTDVSKEVRVPKTVNSLQTHRKIILKNFESN